MSETAGPDRDASGATAAEAAKAEVVQSVEQLGTRAVEAMVGELSADKTLALASATVANLSQDQVEATVGSLSSDQTQVLATAAVQSLDQQGVAAAVDNLSPQQTQVLASAAVEKLSTDEVVATVKTLDPEKQLATASASVSALSADARLGWFDEIVNSMGTVEQAKIRESLAPQSSGDRKAVYLAGFIAAAVLALLFGLIACFAGDEGVRTAAIAAAVSVPSVILGGLMGALTGK